MNAKPAVLAGQAVARGRVPAFSHAAMAIDDYSYVDSLADRGIGIAKWADLDSSMRIRVLRYRPTAARASERIGRMLEHYGKAYNFAFALKDHPLLRQRFGDAFYCSEFVAKVFSREELGLTHTQRTVLPADLELLLDNPNWDDVTHLYRPFMEGTLQSSGVSNAELFRNHGELQVEIRKQRVLMARNDELVDELGTTLKNLAAMLEQSSK